MAETILFYPSQGAGHLNSMLELANLITKHYPSFSIIIIISTPIPSHALHPAITFLHLSAVPHPEKIFSAADIPARMYESVSLNNSNFQHILIKISESSIVKALIIDFFCTPALEVSRNLNIPTYFFFTTCANVLATFLHYPRMDKSIPENLKDLTDSVIDIPGLPIIRPSDLPKDMQDRNRKIYRYFVDIGKKLAESSGIIVNTFDLLEKKAVKAIRDGKCVPEGTTPPVYCIGPLINGGGGGGENECLNWLNSQPSQSVLLLSFGSMGSFRVKQLNEMAKALENSGVRFIWVVRNPPPENYVTPTLETPEISLESIMPKGFLERTKERGLVVKSWAPQVAILNHDSVGGFVTHCGWNSVLESVGAGVPMLAWPLYAEQKLNKVVLVEEMKVAVAVFVAEDGFVTAVELEKRVTELMTESEERRAILERVRAMRDGAAAAVSENGTSRIALAELAESFGKELM